MMASMRDADHADGDERQVALPEPIERVGGVPRLDGRVATLEFAVGLGLPTTRITTPMTMQGKQGDGLQVIQASRRLQTARSDPPTRMQAAPAAMDRSKRFMCSS